MNTPERNRSGFVRRIVSVFDRIDRAGRHPNEIEIYYSLKVIGDVAVSRFALTEEAMSRAEMGLNATPDDIKRFGLREGPGLTTAQLRAQVEGAVKSTD